MNNLQKNDRGRGNRRPVRLTEAQLQYIIDESVRQTLIEEGFLSNAWNGMKNVAGGMWDAAKAAGNTASAMYYNGAANGQIQKLQKMEQQYEAQLRQIQQQYQQKIQQIQQQIQQLQGRAQGKQQAAQGNMQNLRNRMQPQQVPQQQGQQQAQQQQAQPQQ